MTLTCHNKTENWGKSVPYLWTIFFRVDGACVIIDQKFKLVGKGDFQYGKGSHGNLNVPGISQGQTVLIPADVGEWTTYMTPLVVPYFGQKVPSIIGAISVLMEQNNVSDKGAEAGHKALNQQVEFAVNQSLVEFDPKYIDINDVMGSVKKYFETKVAAFTDSIQDEIIKAIKKEQNIFRNLWSLLNADNMIGHHVWNFNQRNILESEEQSIDFGHRWQTEKQNDWEIKGNISIVPENTLDDVVLDKFDDTENSGKETEVKKKSVSEIDSKVEKESNDENTIKPIENITEEIGDTIDTKIEDNLRD